MTCYENIPTELKKLNQWVCTRGDSKVPMKAWKNEAASSVNPQTWADFDTAHKSVTEGHYDYCGFVFNDNGLVGVDIDAGYDGDGFLSQLAADIIGKCQSYTEKSKSGRGFHILLRGDLPFKGKNNLAGVEIYKSSRYFIMTGDNVSGLTGRPAGTDGKVDVVWRGIEGLWGNVWEWVDGVNWNGGTYYVCNDPSKYADDTATNYTALSFKGATNWSSSYITQEGLDTGSNPHVMLPSAAGSGSETTYDCDACWSSTGWRVFIHGGVWAFGSGCGLFAAYLGNASSPSDSGIGSRLLYIPS